MSEKNAEERVRVLEDRQEIIDLTIRYNRAFDDMDVEKWIGTFTTDGEFLIEHPEQSAPETIGHERLRDMHAAIGFGTVHMTTDHLIQVEGDRATQQCSLFLGVRTEARESGTAQYATSGRYADDLVRTRDGWRFTRRVWMPDSPEPLPAW